MAKRIVIIFMFSILLSSLPALLVPFIMRPEVNRDIAYIAMMLLRLLIFLPVSTIGLFGGHGGYEMFMPGRGSPIFPPSQMEMLMQHLIIAVPFWFIIGVGSYALLPRAKRLIMALR